MQKGKQIMEIRYDHEGCKLVDKKKKKKQDEEDPEQTQEQGHHQLVAADYQDYTESNSMLPLPAASCSDQGNDELRVEAIASAAVSTSKGENTVEEAKTNGRRLPPSRRYWWGDCAPHVVLLREALLSSAPDIAVLGPLHGCFAFYMTHLHNEVLSSSYARTMTLGPNVTRVEAAFMWVGGWRPTAALVLVYSLMGIDIENALQAVHAGRSGGESSTSSVLSTRQLAVMHTLQKHTQHAEMKISKKLTVLQMLLGDQDVLEAVLQDAASPVANDSSRFNLVAAKRMSRFRRILVQAEELRLHTLKDLLSLLTPIQAARCGVAVFEMCSSLRTMGSKLPPRLPTLAIPSSPVVAIQSMPAPVSSSIIDKPLVLAGFVEPLLSGLSSENIVKPLLPELSAPNVLNSHDLPLCQLLEPVDVDFSSSENSIVESSEAPLSQSHKQPLLFGVLSSSETMNTSDVLLSRSDETALLVPSCSNSSSSRPLAQASSRSSHNEESSRILSTIGQPLLKLKLDDESTDGMVPTTVGPPLRVGSSEEKEIISNRLLLLSPASSDVVIQNCSLDTAELGPYFERRVQLPRTTDDLGEESHERQPGSSENGDIGGSWQIQPCSMPMSVLWIWRIAQFLRCFLHLHHKCAEWLRVWMAMLWRESTLEVM